MSHLKHHQNPHHTTEPLISPESIKMTSTDESFKSRVEKIFGSLTSSSPSPSSCLKSTLWSLSGEEVERKQWRRDSSATSDRDDLPCSSSFDEIKKERRRNSFDDNVAEGFKESVDEWEIRANIGLDSTLDKEEEEDEFDKVATGRENAGDRLYMKDVSDHESYLNYNNVFSNSLHCGKDPRANHMAAKIRLKEDSAEGRKLGSRVDYGSESGEQLGKVSGGDAGNVRPILKRKKDNSDSKSQKRVRFDPSCEFVTKESASGEMLDSSEEVNDVVPDDESVSSRKHSEVPDYLRNPSKYTRYSFDSSIDADEKSNTHACMDTMKLVRSSKVTDMEMEQEDASAGCPKSVTFIPRKKASEAEGESNRSEMKLDKEEYGGDQSMQQQQQQKGSLAGIAAIESQPSEVDTHVEDEPETSEGGRRLCLQKPGRKYRTKMNSSDADDDS